MVSVDTRSRLEQAVCELRWRRYAQDPARFLEEVVLSHFDLAVVLGSLALWQSVFHAVPVFEATNPIVVRSVDAALRPRRGVREALPPKGLY